MSIAAALLILVILFQFSSFQELKSRVCSEIKKPASKMYFALSCLLTLACATSLLFAKLYPMGYGGEFVNVHFFRDMAKVWYFFWPLLLVIGLKQLDEKDQHSVFKSWLAGFFILSLIGILQHFIGWPRPQFIPTQPNYFHTTLFLGHHLSVASIFIFPFFMSLDMVWQSRHKKRFPLTCCVAAAGLLALFFTYSRMLWIALPVGLFVWILLRLKGKRRVWVALIAMIAAFAFFQNSTIQLRFKDAMGVQTRFDLWQANLEFFKARPLTGVGWHHNLELSGFYLQEKTHSKDVFSGHAHNNLLDVLSTLGLFGLFSILLWYGFLIFAVLKRQRDLKPIDFSRGLACAWIVFHLNGLTQLNLWEAKIEHQIAWVIAWTLL